MNKLETLVVPKQLGTWLEDKEHGLEVAVIKWDKDSDDWQIDYTTPITDDVVGHVDDLDLVLGEIYDLPEDLELEEEE